MENKPAEPRRLDENLRQLLEPNPLTVERLVRVALEEGEPAPGDRSSLGRRRFLPGRGRWWPRLALASAMLMLLVFLIPRFSVDSPPVADPPSDGARQTARISISNDDGFVTVYSTAGAKWILYSGDNS